MTNVDLIIVGCGKAKRAGVLPARKLYSSSLFAAKRQYAESSGCPWLIASARYHLLLPGQVVKPYSLALTDLDDWLLWWWRWRIRRCLEEGLGFRREEPLTIEIHAGRFYREQLKLAISKWFPLARYIEPTAGMGLVAQMVWYRRQREERQAA